MLFFVDKGNILILLSQFGWTHVTFFLLGTQAYLAMQNVLEGLFWFLLPVSMVICNDIMAYIFGKYVCGMLWSLPWLVSALCCLLYIQCTCIYSTCTHFRCAYCLVCSLYYVCYEYWSDTQMLYFVRCVCSYLYFWCCFNAALINPHFQILQLKKPYFVCVIHVQYVYLHVHRCSWYYFKDWYTTPQDTIGSCNTFCRIVLNCVDSENLKEAVCSFPCVWQVSLNFYRDTRAKVNDWKEIHVATQGSV